MGARMKVWMLSTMMVCGASGAQAQQTVTEVTAVNTENGKAVKRITFDREQVTIAYADGTVEEGVQMASIQRHVETGINSLTPSPIPEQSLTPSPSRKGEGSSYFMLDGRETDSRMAAKGIYIIRQGNQVRKMVKK